jgi:uncharacterized protein YjbJ (UPF0337 family)
MAAGSRKKTEGKADRIKGKVKEVAGRATGNRSLKSKGKRDQAKGKAKEAVGEIQKAAHKIKDALTP